VALSHGAVAHDDVCTTVPGSETYLGRRRLYRADSPVLWIRLDLRNYQVMQGRFHFDG
jgi:hypothetical protein